MDYKKRLTEKQRERFAFPQFVANYIEWTKEEDYHLNLKLLINTFVMTMASAFISVQVLEVILENLTSKS